MKKKTSKGVFYNFLCRNIIFNICCHHRNTIIIKMTFLIVIDYHLLSFIYHDVNHAHAALF